MKHLALFLLFALFLVAFKSDDKVKLDKDEAKKAFKLLNKIRIDPAGYTKEMRLRKNLKITRTELVWNDDLAKAAEARAYDMANRKYFNHVDPEGFGVNHHIKEAGYELSPEWTRNKRSNFFESIQAGAADGEELIRMLIIDKGVSSFGHRDHLLGIGKWNASLVDIGIGFARRKDNRGYPTYASIIIAKHF